MLINTEYQATYLRLSDTTRAALERLAEQERRLSVGDALDPSFMAKLLRAATHLIEHNHDWLVVETMVIQAANFASREIEESLRPKPKRGPKFHKWWTRKRDIELLRLYRAKGGEIGKMNLARGFAKSHPTYDKPARVKRYENEDIKDWGPRERENYEKQAKSIVTHLDKLLEAESQRERDDTWRSDVNNIIASGLFSDLLD